VSLFSRKCGACAAKDAIIQDLRSQVEAALKTSLAVIDAKAYAIRFAAERSPRPEGATSFPPSSPAEFRRRSVRSLLSPEEIEASFAAEAGLAQEAAGATGKVNDIA